ncbi:efflux RND transporter periplasmic adaptor subunit [Singulisphaera sp. PoT]|uniref:efflux RND transporter periplasmic adaptor subunit n=1 Tax=Singulisphaera sp. PoT TaxID=3411797 RepID=UPI003BF513D6
MKSRISRGKDSLRKQLLKRGYRPDAGLIAPASMAQAIPHALLESTRRLVDQALTSKSIGQGAATTLAQGVYRSMMLMRWSKLATLLLVVGASATGATILAHKQVAFGEDKGSSQPGDAPKPLAELQSTTIKPGPLKVSAVERGNLEASRSLTVKNPTIASRVVSALPYGKRVTAGQVVLELDPEPYLSRVESLRKPVSAAKLAFEEAELQAELAKGEYEEDKNVNLPKAEAKSLNAIKLAESEKEEHEYSLTRIQKIQGRVQGLQANNDRAMDVAAINAELDIVDRIQREKLAIKRADLAIAEARLAHQIFLDFEKSSRLKALEMQFQIKQKIEHERVRDYESAQEPLQKLYRGVEACHVKTDIDGILVYDYGFDPDEAVEDGSIISVQPNQPMFRVFNDQEPMRVNATVREAIVDQVAKGQKVLITVDAFPGQRFSGTVASIAPRPIKDAMNRPPGPIKFYTTMIDLDKVETALRPGMTAGVEIIIKEIDRTLAVPVSAVLHLDNKDQIAIKKSGGDIEWREVTLGATNGEVVEVRKGISSGEEVIVTPLELLSEAERKERLGKPRRPARRR